jgi:hypothetical protein
LPAGGYFAARHGQAVTLHKAQYVELFMLPSWLRVPEEIVNQVDTLRRKGTGKISRNTWILEVIEDKLEREGFVE